MSSISAGTAAGTALVSTGDTTGTLQLQVNGTTPSITLAANGSIGVGSTPGYGTSGQVLTSAGTGSAPTWATVSSGFTLGTPVVTTSGTIISFTGIPSGVKQVVVTFKNVSSNSTGALSIQLGTSAGITTSGYNSSALGLPGSGTPSVDGSSTLFVLTGDKPASNLIWGSVTLTLENSTNNTWVSSGLLLCDGAVNIRTNMSGGYVALSGVLTQLRIQSLGDTFDSGEINIAYI